MTSSANPALIACLYSLIVVCAALLMGQRRRDNADGSTTYPFRPTGISLSLVAILLPAVRLLTTRDPGDLLLLVGAMAAGVAAAVSLVKLRPRDLTADDDETIEAQAKARSRRARTISAAQRAAFIDVIPFDQASSAPTVAGEVRRTPAPQTQPGGHVAQQSSSEPTAVDLAVTDLYARLHAQLPPAPTTPTQRAAHTLHVVDETVDDVAKRLRLS